MDLKRAIRRVIVDCVAFVVGDRRDHTPLSYPWLNARAWQIIRRSSAAGRRPQYVWGILHAAALARALGYDRISAIELGVAGGRGLVAMEAAAEMVSSITGVGVDVAGFDTGTGLPRPQDPRDLPNLYREGEYVMDVAALEGQLRAASLILGPLRDTLDGFLGARPSPLGFISCDLDLYTSTVDAFPLFEAHTDLLLPRVYLYMDDVMGYTFCEWNGERLAIKEFNGRSAARKIDLVHGLRHDLPWPLSTSKWPDMTYLLHCFDHPAYGSKDNLIAGGEAPL